MQRRSSMLWTFGITSVALFMVTLDHLVVTSALPVIRHNLHASLSQLEWTVNAYTLTFAVLLLTGAALGDRFGRRLIFVVGILVFTAGSALAALSTSATALDLARGVQGVGGAIVTPLTLTLLSAAVPRERRGLARGRRRARRRRGGRRAVRALGAARRGADAADALLPEPDVHAHQRLVAVHVLRDVRVDLLADPVLPDRPGLLAAAGGAADPPL